MQHEISDAVRVLVGSPPQVFVAQQLQAAVDLRQVLVRQEAARGANEFG